MHDQPTTVEGESEKVAFQRWFEEATLRWTSGDHDDAYDESFAAFTARVEAALTGSWTRCRAGAPPSC